MLRIVSIVAPAMSTNSNRATARTMFAYDSRLTPFSMPASTDARPTAVISAMMAAWIHPSIGMP